MRPAGLAEVEAPKGRPLGDGVQGQRNAGSRRTSLRLGLQQAAPPPSSPRSTPPAATIVYRLHTAKKPETRQKRFDAFLAMLARGEKLH